MPAYSNPSASSGGGGGGTPSGPAGGDFAGTYPNPTLATTQTGAHTWSATQTFGAGATKLYASGGLSVNIGNDPGANNIGVANTGGLYHDNSGTYRAMVLGASGAMTFGNASDNTSITTQTNIAFQIGAGITYAQLLKTGTTGILMIGNGHGTASPLPGILQGADAVGANLTGAALTVRAGLGTGSSTAGNFIVQSAPAGGAGSTANTPQTALTVFGADGGIATGTLTTSPGAGTLGVPNTGGLTHDNSGTYRDMVRGASGVVTFGNNSDISVVNGAGVYLRYVGSNTAILLSSTVMAFGINEGTAGPGGGFTLRAAQPGGGTDMAGGALTLASGLPRGAGTVPALFLDGAQQGGTTGTTQATQIHLAEFLDSSTGATTGGDTAMLLSWYNGTTRVVARVTTGVADSGGSGFRLLRVAN